MAWIARGASHFFPSMNSGVLVGSARLSPGFGSGAGVVTMRTRKKRNVVPQEYASTGSEEGVLPSPAATSPDLNQDAHPT